MTFNLDKFERAQFTPRTEAVAVPGLTEYLGPDSKGEWVVRGLNSAELHIAMEAGKRQVAIEAVIEAVAKGGNKVDAVRKALGLTKDTPGEIAKRLEMLVTASVSPTITLPQAVKLAEHFAIEFFQLTNKITELTGMGSVLVKPTADSRKTKA